MFVSVFVWECRGGYVHMSAGTQGCQKRASDPMELKLEVFVSYLTWVLGMELGME